MPRFPKSAGQNRIFDWPGGRHTLRLNKRDDSTRLGKHEFDILKNMYTRGGVVQRRLGYTGLLAAALASAVKSIAWWQNVNDVTKFFAFAGTTAYALTGSPGAGVATDTTAGFTTTNKKRARQYNDKLYAVEGAAGPRVYDGATWAAMVPNVGAGNEVGTVYFNTAKHIAVGFDRTWYAGSAQYPQYLWPSEVGDPTYCKIGNVIKIDSQDGQDITGLLEWGRYILIPKDRSVWAVPNKNPADTTFGVFRITAAVGCPAGDSMKGWNNHCFFLGSDKRVYQIYMGQVIDDLRAVSISDLIQSDLNALTDADLLAAEAVIYDDFYILAAGGKWFVLDLQESTLSQGADGAVWAGPYEHAATQTAPFVHPVDRTLYGADPTGQVHLHWKNGISDLTTDNGTPIDFDARRGWEDDGRQELYKLNQQMFNWVKATTDNATITVQIDTDQQASAYAYDLNLQGKGFTLGVSQLGVDKLGLEGEVIQNDIIPPSTGRRIRMRFMKKSGSDPSAVKILGYTRYFKMLSAY